MNLFHDHDRMKFNLTQKYDIHELFLELNGMMSVSRENHITYNLMKSLKMLHPATVQ